MDTLFTPDELQQLRERWSKVHERRDYIDDLRVIEASTLIPRLVDEIIRLTPPEADIHQYVFRLIGTTPLVCRKRFGRRLIDPTMAWTWSDALWRLPDGSFGFPAAALHRLFAAASRVGSLTVGVSAVRDGIRIVGDRSDPNPLAESIDLVRVEGIPRAFYWLSFEEALPGIVNDPLIHDVNAEVLNWRAEVHLSVDGRILSEDQVREIVYWAGHLGLWSLSLSERREWGTYVVASDEAWEAWTAEPRSRPEEALCGG